MHKKLSESPIIYVLGQIRFSNIENISDYIPKLQDVIREAFPHFQKINIQALQFREGQQPSASIFNQWHFMDKDKQSGIILDDRSIAIHTTQYEQFNILLKSLEKTLVLFNEILKIALFTRVGLRYINFIENGLDKLDKSLCGFQLKNSIFEADKFLTKTETTQLSKHGIIKIQATHIGNKEIIAGNKNYFIPPDLADIASVLNFQSPKEPEKDFLLLDLDHFNEQQGDFDVQEILSRLDSLQDILYLAFCSAAGQENLTAWQ